MMDVGLLLWHDIANNSASNSGAPLTLKVCPFIFFFLSSTFDCVIRART